MKFTAKTIAIAAVILVVAAITGVHLFTDVDLLKMFRQDEQGQEPTDTANQDGQQNEQVQLEEGQPCEGVAIKVRYTYPHPEDDFDNPWECEVQCEDGVQRYISYSNGTATQCEPLPGCLDLGEDQAVTCEPPASQQDEDEE